MMHTYMTKTSTCLIALSIISAYALYNVVEQHKISSPNIQTLYSYTGLEMTCDAHTLITFDVDNTLIMSANAHLLSYNFSNVPLSAKIYAMIRYPSLVMNYEHATSILFAQSTRMVTEPIIITILNQLKQQCTVLGLTSMESGHWGVIESMPEWRYNMLTSMGIVFTNVPDHIFNQLSQRRGTYPILYKGMLCTNQEQKGAVLGAYIDQLTDKPAKIIAFDDDYDALRSIEVMCHKYNIAFHGYHYLYATSKKRMLTFNESLSLLAHFQ